MEYNLEGIIGVPFRNNFNCIIFNPREGTLNKTFLSNNIYIHYGMKFRGKIIALKEDKNWRLFGIPYILIYKDLNI